MKFHSNNSITSAINYLFILNIYLIINEISFKISFKQFHKF